MLLKMGTYWPRHTHGSVVDGPHDWFEFDTTEATQIARNAVRAHDPDVLAVIHEPHVPTLLVYRRVIRRDFDEGTETYEHHCMVEMFNEMQQTD